MKLHSSVLFEIVGYSWLNMLADGALVLNWRLNGSRRLPDQNVDVYSIRPSVQCRWRQRLSMTGVQFQCYFYVILLKWIIAYRKRLKFEFIIWCNFLFFFFCCCCCGGDDFGKKISNERNNARNIYNSLGTGIIQTVMQALELNSSGRMVCVCVCAF